MGLFWPWKVVYILSKGLKGSGDWLKLLKMVFAEANIVGKTTKSCFS